jgi:hypothetical protein
LCFCEKLCVCWKRYKGVSVVGRQMWGHSQHPPLQLV